jgi:hypothetical protein
MANYPYELAQDAAYQSHTGRLTGLWFLPKLAQGLNNNNNKEGHIHPKLSKLNATGLWCYDCFIDGYQEEPSASILRLHV